LHTENVRDNSKNDSAYKEEERLDWLIKYFSLAELTLLSSSVPFSPLPQSREKANAIYMKIGLTTERKQPAQKLPNHPEHIFIHAFSRSILH